MRTLLKVSLSLATAAAVLLLPAGMAGRDASAAVAQQSAAAPAAAAFASQAPVRQPPKDIPDWQARWELARALSYLKRYDESLAEYRKVLKEMPKLFEAQAEMANVLLSAGSPSDALKALEQIPVGSLGEKDRLMMADLYVIQRRYQQAEGLYTDYLGRHPDDLRVRLKRAEMLSWAKNYDASLAEYQKILNARPEDIQVRRKYAQVLIWASRFDDAARELRRTLK